MTLGIIAAAGAEPAEVIHVCRARGRAIFVVALEGYADPQAVAGVHHAWVRLGAAGQMLKLMRKAGVTEVVFAGDIDHFSLQTLRPDLWTATFIARHGPGLFRDEKRLIKAIVAEIERKEGLKVVDARSLLSA
jgi:DUF1009 family protein